MTSNSADRAGIEPEVKVAQRQPGRHRQLVPVEVELQHRCLAARRPGAATMRLLTQSAFVDEDDRTFFFAGFFLMAGQVLRCQPRMASSLRSRALPTGRCGLQPSAPRDLPDMALVIAHAELVSDQTSDPRTAPQRRREAVRLGAFQQQRLEAFELRGVQQRLTAGAAGLAQPGFAVTPVSSQPLADALPRDLQSPRCLGLTTALLDQPDRFETALLQGLEIPPYAFCISHTYKDVRTPKRCHFILRDSIRIQREDIQQDLVLAAVSSCCCPTFGIISGRGLGQP